MRGIDEAKAFYLEYGQQMIREKFPEYESRIAVGLAGHGSECFGFDDEISRDHDFELGFCLWLTDEDDLKIGVELSRAYRALPIVRAKERSSMAESKLGVHRISDFYKRYTGSATAPESWQHWMSLPSYALAEASNGQVWRDDLGIFSRIRKEILHGMPEDVRKKKIAAKAVEMAQAGQYNYSRCLAHGQNGAAMMALGEFVKSGCEMVFLLNRCHMPYYKWCFKAMESLPKLSNLKEALEFLLTGENDSQGQIIKKQVIEDICASIISELKTQGLSNGNWDYLEPHAFEIQESIEIPELKVMHIMADSL